MRLVLPTCALNDEIRKGNMDVKSVNVGASDSFITLALRNEVVCNLTNDLFFVRILPLTSVSSKSDQSALQQGESQTGADMHHDLTVCFVTFVCNQLRQSLVQFQTLRSHSASCCEYQWSERALLDI